MVAYNATERNTMNLLKHLYIAFLLYRLGYWFSKNTHEHESWGFYRINFSNGDYSQYAIVDIDFNYSRKGRDNYVHMHGGPNEANYDLHRFPTRDNKRHRWLFAKDGVRKMYS